LVHFLLRRSEPSYGRTPFPDPAQRKIAETNANLQVTQFTGGELADTWRVPIGYLTGTYPVPSERLVNMLRMREKSC